jgi:methyltransferase (TIGR00027 family)
VQNARRRQQRGERTPMSKTEDSEAPTPPNQQGRTAEGAAAGRAAHRLYTNPVVFDDPWAIDLISPATRFIVRSRLLHHFLIARKMKPFRNVLATSLASFRYTEERVDAGVESGIAQYVIIGAGLDSFALRRRDLADRLRVFEVDHPATQRLKRERIARVGSVPKNLEFAPVDFEVESIAQALSPTSFDSSQPALVSWLNTTPYLTSDAIFATLSALTDVLAPGSELVFNYAVTREFLDPADIAGFDFLSNHVKSEGEPWRSAFNPDVFPGEVEALGYRLVEQFTMSELGDRYFQNRSDGLRPAFGGRLARFEVMEKNA